MTAMSGSDDDFAKAHPTTAVLVMEIVVSSEEIDREKGAIYAEAEIPEFWLVLALEKVIELHTAPREGGYTQKSVFRMGDTVQSLALPKLRVSVAALFPSV